MYAQFFGLSQEPFSIAPDPRYLFMSERHREALAHLLYGAQGGGGFVLLTGEIGAGKTTICRCFMEQVPAHCRVAYIFNPRLTVIELLRSVCDDFGISYPRHAPGDVTIKDYIDPLNDFLLRSHAEGQSNILIIDEAQMLPTDVLEQLRLLTNLETAERKLLQIMLIGQPELRDMLERPELEQLAQRVIARFHLSALDARETAQYIAHRLTIAGLRTASPFTADAIKRIQRWTRGVPRRINLLCDRALLGAYSQGLPQVDRQIIDKAAQEVFGRLLKAQRQSSRPDQPGPPPAERDADTKVRPARWAKPLLWALIGVGSTAVVASAILAFKSTSPGGNPAPGTGTMSMAATAPPEAQRATTAPASGTTQAARAATATEPASMPGTAVSAWSSTLSGAATRPPGEPASIDGDPQAWAALGKLWHASLNPSSPCEDASNAHLACFRSEEGLSLIQKLGRPGVITLHDDQGRLVHALLTGLGPQSATVHLGSTRQTISLAALAKRWQGDFATLWITPPEYRRKLTLGAKGPAVDWLATRLATLQNEPPPTAGQPFGAELQAKVRAFQLTQGLKPDGVAGSTTLMQLNRATGVAEPRLTSEK